MIQTSFSNDESMCSDETDEFSWTPSSSPLARDKNRFLVIRQALENGIEISIGATRLKFFNSNDIVRTPSGYFQIDEPQLMCSITQRGAHALAYFCDEGLWDWLDKQSAMMSDESFSKIASASYAIHTLKNKPQCGSSKGNVIVMNLPSNKPRP